MASQQSLPVSVTDFLMHVKDDENCEDGNERVLLPFTRYDNIFNSPKVVSNVFKAPGAPFVLFETNEVELDENYIRELCGDIL